jgi:RNA polymerase sigma-70 factor (ECF subfamily)
MKSYQDFSDSELSEAIRSSNDEAFKVFYYRYYEQIYHFLWHRTFSPDLAKDFVQEVFARLWQHREKLDPRKSIKAFLYRIANNLSIDYIRKHASEMNYRKSLPNQKIVEESIEVRMSIETAVQNLPERLRSVFIMSRFQGLKYYEIARACKISVKTVESRISQALQLLRVELQ